MQRWSDSLQIRVFFFTTFSRLVQASAGVGGSAVRADRGGPPGRDRAGPHSGASSRCRLEGAARRRRTPGASANYLATDARCAWWQSRASKSLGSPEVRRTLPPAPAICPVIEPIVSLSPPASIARCTTSASGRLRMSRGANRANGADCTTKPDRPYVFATRSEMASSIVDSRAGRSRTCESGKWPATSARVENERQRRYSHRCAVARGSKDRSLRHLSESVPEQEFQPRCE